MSLENMAGAIPFHTFKKPICRGSFMLNSACGRCEKCYWVQAKMNYLGLTSEHPADTRPHYPTAQEEETLP